MSSSKLDAAFQSLVIDDEGRACRDIPDSACKEQPRNFFTHVGALSLSKSADGLIDPKLVLSWLLTSLGAPAFMIGLLVPIREAGALLPQLFTAATIRKVALRKYVWAAGSLLQGLSAIGIGLSAMLLDGRAAGFSILLLLAILAIARSACSVSYKDVLGKTVSKTNRGTATGLAGSVSAIATIIFAALLVFEIVPRANLVVTAIFTAGGVWMSASLLFVALQEQAGATEGGASAFEAARENFGLLREDPQLRRFIAVRGLLTATALAPPFMVAAGSKVQGASLDSLGFLVLASAASALVSSYFWGRLADRSSRQVLILSGAIGTLALAATALSGAMNWLAIPFILPALLFVLMLAYQGVRLGRSTHLVDMATSDTRAAYTALSNTVIGTILLFGAVFGAIAQVTGPETVLAIMAALCVCAFATAFGLEEVQDA